MLEIMRYFKSVIVHAVDYEKKKKTANPTDELEKLEIVKKQQLTSEK